LENATILHDECIWLQTNPGASGFFEKADEKRQKAMEKVGPFLARQGTGRKVL
jgi:hypothetical protein